MNKYVKRMAACATALAFAFGGAALPAAGGAGLDLGISASADTADTAVEASGKCGYDSVVWALDETGTLTISGSGDMYSFYGGDTPWKNYNSMIKKVVIEGQVTRIGDSAFQNLPVLESVTIGDSVTWIGYDAFENSTKLSEIVFPESVTFIGSRAFDNTAWLKARQEEDPLVIVGGLLVDGKAASGDVTVPEGVTRVLPNAFYKCQGITSVVLPEGVEKIDLYAFLGCENLKSAALPESLKHIASYAFGNCTALEDVNIPAGVTYIGGRAFGDTPWFEALREEEPVVIINNILLEAAAAEGEFTVPEGVTMIGEFAFYGCNALTALNIPESVTRIDASACRSCENLESVTIPASVRYIGDYAFYLSGLKEITVPRSVTYVGDRAFGRISNIEKVKGFKVHCYDGSVAEKYAVENYLEHEYEEDALSLSLSCQAEAGKFKRGDTLEVKLNLDENTGLNRLSTGIRFNSSVFEFIGAESCGDMEFEEISPDEVNQKGIIPVEWSDKTRTDNGYTYLYYNKGAVLTLKFKVKDGYGNYDFHLTGTMAERCAISDSKMTYHVPAEEKDCTVRVSNTSDEPCVPSPYPDIKAEVKGRQFRLTWSRVYRAEKYGLAVYQSGKWRVKVQFDNSVLSYTSPKLKAGTYHLLLCAKVNGKWCVSTNRQFKVSIGCYS